MNKKGISLIEVIVVAAIGSIIAIGMATMVSNFNKDFKAFDEKAAIQSLQLQIQGALSSAPFCKCFIGSNTFDYSTSTWNGFPTAISASYNTSCVGGGGSILSVGTKIGNSNITPISMRLNNITETVANSGNFSASLDIDFDQNALVRSRKGISIPIYFTVKMSPPEPPSARILSSCGSTQSSLLTSTNPPVIVDGGAYFRSGPALPSWTAGAQNLNCPPGAIMTGIVVNTSGTAQHHADGDGPIIQSIHLKCMELQ